MKRHTFTAEIKEGRGSGAYAEIPFDVEAAFGSKQPVVRAMIEGEELTTRLVRMGQPCHIIGVPKALRVQSGKDVGSTIRIAIEAQPAVRPEIVVPPDLEKALKGEKSARVFFDGLSYTHRKEYVRWITEAKRDETRVNRVAKTIEMLKAGKKGV